jgi:probable F420-dependent oxidoreductase|tara:strand:- start:1390 stop:2247 length:858 start_codon:yes stop_codon:yes gene_type:complete
MKFGIMFANTGYFGLPEHAAELATVAEEAGFDSLWTVEHVLVPKGYESIYPYHRSGRLRGPDESPMPDPILWMSFVAALTKTIKLSTGVLILPQRHPAYVAKEFATLDSLSGGRAMLGVGIGWLEEEFDALGVPFKHRVARTEESIKAIRDLWKAGPSTFEGEHFSWPAVESNPKPVQSPGVPIIIGGHVPAAARRAARFGDGFFPGRIDRLDELIAALRKECEAIGRNPDDVEITTGTPNMTPDGIKEMEDRGVVRLTVPVPGTNKDDIRQGLEHFAETVISKQ